MSIPYSMSEIALIYGILVQNVALLVEHVTTISHSSPDMLDSVPISPLANNVSTHVIPTRKSDRIGKPPSYSSAYRTSIASDPSPSSSPACSTLYPIHHYSSSAKLSPTHTTFVSALSASR
ncbi:unnamed protein product [Dovyalis caffra]|uniref:Uncharacterized protein n=1 Tax=Dovyalis caffra TaxID=77055 RepID=A0AAV1RA55_9ROSI|nr:unnamed protein product [Dovyalis caffra]